MDLVVSQKGGGTIAWGDVRRRCALGKGGIGIKQREGDGITPEGAWPLRRLFYRADRMDAPRCFLGAVALHPRDGWCDAPDDPCYNRLVRLPHAGGHELLWRDDHLYDLILVIGFNDNPVVAGRGSAIFLHLARSDFSPTQGCVALERNDALAALAQLRPGDAMRIIQG